MECQRTLRIRTGHVLEQARQKDTVLDQGCNYKKRNMACQRRLRVRTGHVLDETVHDDRLVLGRHKTETKSVNLFRLRKLVRVVPAQS
jgi:hypothetical protein